MKHWSISAKLLCLVVFAILTFVGMGLYGIYTTRATFKGVEAVNATARGFQRGTQKISNPLQRIRQLSLLIVMAPDRQLQQTFHHEQEKASHQIDKTLTTWPLDGESDSERAAFADLRTAWNQYRELKDLTIDRAIKGYREEAFINATGAEREEFTLVADQLARWQNAKIDGAEAVYQKAKSQFDWAYRTSFLVTALTALLVAVIAFVIVRSITGPIRVLTATASRIADKVDDAGAEESLAPVLASRDEIGQLASRFSQMVKSLRATIETEKQSRARIDKILASTREAVGQLGTTSAQLLAGTRDQAAGAEDQAAAVSQTVTTMNELTHTADRSAMRAKDVGKTVQRTLGIGKAGRTAVEDSVAALNGVKEQVEETAGDIQALAAQAHRISEIISTVDEIARQSHVLAVNAAIEAAKAGEQGREFAVIAGEIKALAAQSRQGTAQVRKLLGGITNATDAAVGSMKGVTEGVSGAIDEASQSSRTINELADALAEIADASEEIVAAAEQEAIGIAQINEAMKDIDQVARQSLAAVQGTAEAARQLNDLGGNLTRLSAE